MGGHQRCGTSCSAGATLDRTVRCLAAALLFILCGALEARAAAAVTVALDVGHSRKAPGATSARGASEFTFNRDLALAVRERLQAAGVATRMIGEAGDANDLQRRAEAATGADLLLSIHHDSVQPQYLEDRLLDGKHRRVCDRFSGFSVFVSRRNPNIAASLKCASAIGAELRKAGFKPTMHHAEKIRGENRELADKANGVYYFDDLIVLKTAKVPAVLLEAGIIVNPTEELALRETETRQRITRAVANAMSCLQKDK